MKKLLSFTFFVAVTPVALFAGLLVAKDRFKECKQTEDDIETFTSKPEYGKDNDIR